MIVLNLLQLLLLHDGKLLGRDPLAIALVKVFNVPQSVMANDHQTQAFTTQAARVSLSKLYDLTILMICNFVQDFVPNPVNII